MNENFSTYNFIGEMIDGYISPVALLTKEAAMVLRRAGKDFMKMGYRIRVFDAYRPQRAVDHFVRWARDLDDVRMKEIFYPDVDKENLFLEGYIAQNSGHSRGSTVDITLFDMARGTDADMGSCFDLFGDISHSDYEDISKEQLDNRKLLREVMIQNGFIPLREEWWHFSLKDEPYPDTYFAFPVSSDYLKR
jgi:D-alanyl-D-alanine dipeptidase